MRKFLCSLLVLTLLSPSVFISSKGVVPSVSAASEDTEPSFEDLLYSCFKDPADDMSSKPLFFWNLPLDSMTEDELREIVRRSYEESGYSGFGILPFWLDGYLSDRYFELYEAALDEGSKYGMKFSLYDENGFPSYTAGGLFAKKYPELTAKRLDMVESAVVKDGKIFLKIPQEKLMGAVAFNTVTNEIIDITDRAVIVDLPDFDPDAQPVGIVASSEFGTGYEVDKAFDGNTGTRWNAAAVSGGGQYIIINYGVKTKLDAVELFEDPDIQRVKGCNIEYWDADQQEWIILGSTDSIGSTGARISFDQVEEQYYRIHFQWVSGDSASITEIKLYADGQQIANPPCITAAMLNQKTTPGYYSSTSFSSDYDAVKAFDNDPNTRWSAAAAENQWISAMFGETVTIDSVEISEAYDRIDSFYIQYYDKGTWRTCAEGTTIGANLELSFNPVTTTGIRLFIPNTPAWATIYEFKLFSNGKQISVGEEYNYAFSSTDFDAEYDASKAFDNDPNTRWSAAAAENQWLGAMFGKYVTIDSVEISEAYDRIDSFLIQYLEDGVWKNCAEGTTVGSNLKLSFDPVTTTGIRIFIPNTPAWATIYEFKLFSNGKQVNIYEDVDEDYNGSYVEFDVGDSSDWKLMAFLCVSQGINGMDYLSEEAVAGFIEITYEEYYKRFKKYFDNGTIASAFYDEPSFWGSGDGLTAWGVAGGRMWTDDYNEVFTQMFGDEQNPVVYYPALWYDIGEKTAEARDRLNAVRTEMFAKHYIGQVNEWCEAHGIELMGHMLWEDQDNPVRFHGDLMYCFKYQACPTVDVIGYYGMTEDYYKIISSSAYNWDHPHVGVECYGAISNMPVNVLYKQAMDLFAKGINVMVPHAVWYSSTENVWFQPELSYRTEPYASALPQYNKYIARLQTMLQEGRHVADIAVLYPIDTLEYDYNFNRNDYVNPDSNYIALTEQLSESIRLDFTYLHPSILDEKVTVNGSTLHLDNQNNFENYSVMILPAISVISKSNLEKIYDFYQNGGIVISVGALPTIATEEQDTEAVNDMIKEMFGESETIKTDYIEKTNGNGGQLYHIADTTLLGETLEKAYDNYDVKVSSVDENNGHFTYIHKVRDERNVFFFANSSDISVQPTVTLAGEYHGLEVWNPITGERTPVSATVENGKTTFTLEFDPVSSLFVVEACADFNPTFDTAEDLLIAAYALSDGQYLANKQQTYSLTGVITQVNTAYSAQYGVSVTIVADGLTDYPIQCYRMVNGEGVRRVRLRLYA